MELQQTAFKMETAINNLEIEDGIALGEQVQVDQSSHKAWLSYTIIMPGTGTGTV